MTLQALVQYWTEAKLLCRCLEENIKHFLCKQTLFLLIVLTLTLTRRAHLFMAAVFVF